MSPKEHLGFSSGGGLKSSSQGQWLDSSDRCGLVKVTMSWNKVSHAKVQCLQTRDLVAFFSIRRLLGMCTTVKRCPAWNATGKGLDLARCDALEESAAQGLFLTTWYLGRSKHLCLYDIHVIWIYFLGAPSTIRVPHNGSVAANWRNSLPPCEMKDLGKAPLKWDKHLEAKMFLNHHGKPWKILGTPKEDQSSHMISPKTPATSLTNRRWLHFKVYSTEPKAIFCRQSPERLKFGSWVVSAVSENVSLCPRAIGWTVMAEPL